jgi:hypothetical protein
LVSRRRRWARSSGGAAGSINGTARLEVPRSRRAQRGGFLFDPRKISRRNYVSGLALFLPAEYHNLLRVAQHR